MNISPWYPLVRKVDGPHHPSSGEVLILSCVADRPQASIFSQYPSHPFTVRKCWEARPLKTVNRQLGFAKFAGQDRRFSQLARADAGALVNRSSEKIAIDSVRGRSSLLMQRGLDVESGHADFPGDGTMKGRKACFQTKEAAEKVVSRKLKDLLQ